MAINVFDYALRGQYIERLIDIRAGADGPGAGELGVCGKAWVFATSQGMLCHQSGHVLPPAGASGSFLFFSYNLSFLK